MLSPFQRRWSPDADVGEMNSVFCVTDDNWSRGDLWWQNPHCALEGRFLHSNTQTR
jgi:hypothetical protein